jgi:hypothetical protein
VISDSLNAPKLTFLVYHLFDLIRYWNGMDDNVVYILVIVLKRNCTGKLDLYHGLR